MSARTKRTPLITHTIQRRKRATNEKKQKAITSAEGGAASRSAHVLPGRARDPDRQLAQVLPLLQVLHLCVDQIAQALEVDAALRARAHEYVAPDARRGDRVIDGRLHRAVEPHHLLHQVVRTWVHRVGPGNADGEPPSEGLEYG